MFSLFAIAIGLVPIVLGMIALRALDADDERGSDGPPPPPPPPPAPVFVPVAPSPRLKRSRQRPLAPSRGPAARPRRRVTA